VNAARSTARRVINSTLAVARPGSVEWDSRRRARVRRPGWGRPAGTTRKPEEDSMVRTVDLKDPHRPETAVGHGGHGRPRGRESAGPRLAALHGDLNRSRRRPSTDPARPGDPAARRGGAADQKPGVCPRPAGSGQPRRRRPRRPRRAARRPALPAEGHPGTRRAVPDHDRRARATRAAARKGGTKANNTAAPTRSRR
jgi:hypothetical protein